MAHHTGIQINLNPLIPSPCVDVSRAAFSWLKWNKVDNYGVDVQRAKKYS